MPRVLGSLALLCLTAIWLFGTRGNFGVPGQWIVAPNARPWPASAWLLPLGALFIFGGAAALSVYDRFKRAKTVGEKRNSTLTALFCLAVLLFLWPWTLLGPGAISQAAPAGQPPRPPTLEGRFNIIAALWSDVATEYFGAAYQINDARQFGREYASKWQKPASPFQAHIATHPPGAVLWFYGARRIYEAVPPLQSGFTSLAQSLTRLPMSELQESAALLRHTSSVGMGAPAPPVLPASAIGGALWAAFLLGMSLVITIPAVYGLAAMGGDGDAGEVRGLFAVGLWVLAPAVNLFAFTLDAPIAAGTVWTLFLAAKSMESAATRPKAARGWMLGAGVLLALTSFISIGALTVGVIVVLALALFRRDQLVPRLLELGGAFLLTWVVLALAFSFNPIQVVLNATGVHRYATLSRRSWAPWTFMNLLMWVPFVGYPLLVCLLRREKPVSIGAQIGLASLATLLLLTLSGNVRGEVERLWLFLVAPVALWAASAAVSPRWRGALLGIQAIQTLLMAATLGPLVRP
jgi:hypothetical protein